MSEERPDVADEDDRGRRSRLPADSPVARVSSVLALVTGAAALVYIAGGVVMMWRLYKFGNAGTEFIEVPNLSREFLVSLGLLEVVLPGVLVGSLYALVVRTIPVFDRASPRLTGSSRVALTGEGWAAARFAIGIALVLGVANLAAHLLDLFRGDSPTSLLATVLAAATLLVYAAGFRVIGLRCEPELVAETPDGKPRRAARPWSCTLLRALVVGLLSVVWIVLYLESKPHPVYAVACSKSAEPIVGLLLAEAGDRIYITDEVSNAAAVQGGDQGRDLAGDRLTIVARDDIQSLHLRQDEPNVLADVAADVKQCPPATR
jgi:hypothetical protein